MSTNKFSSGTIRIDGNGNAVGNGNKVTYVKKTTNNIYNNNSGGGDGKKQSANGELALAGLFFSAIALAALSFWFTRYSALIYDTLTMVGYVSGGLGALATINHLRVDDYTEAFRSTLVALIAAIGCMSVNAASGTMPADLTEFSKMGTFGSFWCGLSLYGQQMASQHSLLGTFILVPLTVLAALQASRAAILAIFDEEELPEWIQSVMESAAGGRAFVGMFVICILCVAAHTQAGDEFWKNQFNSKISYFCGTNK